MEESRTNIDWLELIFLVFACMFVIVGLLAAVSVSGNNQYQIPAGCAMVDVPSTCHEEHYIIPAGKVMIPSPRTVCDRTMVCYNDTQWNTTLMEK